MGNAALHMFATGNDRMKWSPDQLEHVILGSPAEYKTPRSGTGGIDRRSARQIACVATGPNHPPPLVGPDARGSLVPGRHPAQRYTAGGPRSAATCSPRSGRWTASSRPRSCRPDECRWKTSRTTRRRWKGASTEEARLGCSVAPGAVESTSTLTSMAMDEPATSTSSTTPPLTNRLVRGLPSARGPAPGDRGEHSTLPGNHGGSTQPRLHPATVTLAHAEPNGGESCTTCAWKSPE